MHLESQKKTRWPIFSITFLDHLSLNIGFPVLTFIFFDIHSSLFAPTVGHAVRSFWYGIMNSIPQLIAVISTPILSALSDYFGRKILLLLGSLGALIYCGFAAMSILAGSLALLLLGCVISGFYVRTEPIALATIGDLGKSRKKIINMGYIQFFISAGAFIAPLIGGYFAYNTHFHYLNYSLPYIIGTIISIFTFFFILLAFKETYVPSSMMPKFSKQMLKEIFKRPVMKLIVLLTLTQFSWRIFYQYMPPILKVHFFEDPSELGVYIGFLALWLGLATAFGIRIMAKYFNSQRILSFSCYMMFIGFIITIIAILLPPDHLSRMLVWIGTIPIAMGDVIAYSAIVAILSNIVSNNHQGKIMGLCFIIISAVWSLTSLIGGGLAAINIITPILVAPIGLIALWMLGDGRGDWI